MKDNLNKKALKAGVFYVICQFLIRAISFMITPVYTRLMSPEQYGIIRVYDSWLLILIPIVTLSLYRSIEVAKYDYKNKYYRYIGNTILLGLLTSILFVVVCIIFWNPLKSIMQMSDFMMIIMLFYIFAEFAIMCFQRREKQMMNYKSSTLFTSVTVVPAAILSVICILIGKNQGHGNKIVEYWGAGYYLPVIIGGFIIAGVMVYQGKGKVDKNMCRYGLVYSIPLITEVVSIQIMNQSDKIMIQKMIGQTETGIYALAVTVSYILWIIEDAVWGAWQPWMYEKVEREEYNDIQKPWTMMMNGFGFLSLMVVAVGPEVIAILGDKRYGAAIFLIAPLIMSSLFRFYSYSYSAMQNYNKKTGHVALGTIFAMVLNLVLNYIGIRLWGYQAAAYATALSYFVLLIIQGYFEKKVCGMCLISVRKTLVVSGVYFLLCQFMMLTYFVPILLRYGIILVTCVIWCVYNKELILKLVAYIRKK